jgi:hypothetical protein
MIQLSQLLGQDAVSLRTAAQTGTVKGISVAGNRIVTVELSDTSIAASAVRSFEGDVLTYDDSVAPADTEVRESDPRGLVVLDGNGDDLGRLTDLGISAEGVIEEILLSNGESVPGTRLRAIGSYAAVITNELPPPTA